VTIARPYAVAIALFDQVEVLDFAGPYEVFTTASRVARRLGAAIAPFEVTTLSHGGAPVKARAGLLVQADRPFDPPPPIDLLIVPGGVVDAELDDGRLSEWISHVAPRCAITASVCTGAFLLAQAALLDGRAATTHWEDLADLRRQFPDVRVTDQGRWVDEGDVVTSAGISAGIDMSLHLVERLGGRGLALATARQMDVVWTENPSAS
jgi:transcriptional regulator GlxA family with amidase domain